MNNRSSHTVLTGGTDNHESQVCSRVGLFVGASRKIRVGPFVGASRKIVKIVYDCSLLQSMIS